MIAVIVVAYALVNSGIGPVLALGTELVVGSAPREKAGAASAISETSSELGVALGVALRPGPYEPRAGRGRGRAAPRARTGPRACAGALRAARSRRALRAPGGTPTPPVTGAR
ncbi:hypothetical protein [Streptomyces sp. MAR4 CNX-425]|uniref:hypothetical protein n=1 Tax=Streptomyces sp. MAR4 CNX-425 TaxID=3406343 RepID=UPI003B50447B